MTQLYVTQSRYWMLHLATSDFQLEICFLHYLAIGLLSYMYTFWEVSPVLGFHNTSQMALSFSCHSLFSLPHPSLVPIHI